MLKHILLSVFGWVTVSLFAQTPPPQYYTLIKTADSLYYAKQYKAAVITYQAAFTSFGGLALSNDRYSAAKVWALTGNADSAFYNLQRIVDKAAYSNYRQISAEPDFTALHKDARWQKIMAEVKANKDKKEEKYDRVLLHLMDSMVAEEQKWRLYAVDLRAGNAKDEDTTSLKAANYKVFITDSLNYATVKQIFEKHGFPNYDLVGAEGAYNFWLLVQHQDNHPEFQRKVLAAMKAQVDSGKASLTNYAYLLDRVQMNSGELQTYGTQMQLNNDKTSYMPVPVIDPEKLNERRKSVNLEPIEDYIDRMNRNYLGAAKK